MEETSDCDLKVNLLHQAALPVLLQIRNCFVGGGEVVMERSGQQRFAQNPVDVVDLLEEGFTPQAADVSEFLRCAVWYCRIILQRSLCRQVDAAATTLPPSLSAVEPRRTLAVLNGAVFFCPVKRITRPNVMVACLTAVRHSARLELSAQPPESDFDFQVVNQCTRVIALLHNITLHEGQQQGIAFLVAILTRVCPRLSPAYLELARQLLHTGAYSAKGSCLQ